MKGVLPWLVRLARRASTRDFLSCLDCSRQPSTKYFFPHRTLCHFLRRIPFTQASTSLYEFNSAGRTLQTRALSCIESLTSAKFHPVILLL